MAFTYSFMAGRHDVRQALIVREANAIDMALLRSGLLPETPRRKLQALLRQYLDSRILSEEVAVVPSRVAEAVQRSERLQAPKEIELLSIALDASYTHMYAPGTRRHIQAALKVGVTMEEVMEVLKLCVVQGVRACNLGVPILAEELEPVERQHNG